MRVGYVIASLQQPSGWRSHATGLIRAMATRVEPVLFVPTAQTKRARQEFSDLPIIEIPVTQEISPGTLRGALRWAGNNTAIRRMKKLNLDLVHSLEAYPTGLAGDWLARRNGCPHVITCHGTYGVVWYDQPKDRAIYQGVLQRAGLFCPVSHGTAQEVQKFFGASLQNIPIQPVLNGNDFYLKIPREQVERRTLPEVPTLLTVGDVKRRKGQFFSLRAFQIIRRAIPGARYWIAGNDQDAMYTGMLKEFIQRERVEGVEILGTVGDAVLDRLYRESSLFILTSQPGQGWERLHLEGFGLVYLEAGAYGLPVIAADSGGVSDAVRDGETGFLLPPEDVEGMAAAAIRLLSEPGLNRKMGLANRRWAETLTWERNAEETYQLYEKLLNTP